MVRLQVLDMCAAPGSKTFQLLEALHAHSKPGQVRRTALCALGLPVYIYYGEVAKAGGFDTAPGIPVPLSYTLFSSTSATPARTWCYFLQEPTGLVVANDADFKRCNLLQHQTKRVCSPNLLVTNHDAQLFPILKTLDASGQVRVVCRDTIVLCMYAS